MSSVFFRQSAILKDDNFAGAMNKHTGPRQTRKTGDFWAMTQSSTIVKLGVNSLSSFTGLNHAPWPGTLRDPDDAVDQAALASAAEQLVAKHKDGDVGLLAKYNNAAALAAAFAEALRSARGKLTPCAPPQKRRTPEAPSAGTSGSAKRPKHAVLTTGGPLAFLDHSPHVKLVQACVDCRPEARRLLDGLATAALNVFPSSQRAMPSSEDPLYTLALAALASRVVSVVQRPQKQPATIDLTGGAAAGGGTTAAATSVVAAMAAAAGGGGGDDDDDDGDDKENRQTK